MSLSVFSIFSSFSNVCFYQMGKWAHMGCRVEGQMGFLESFSSSVSPTLFRVSPSIFPFRGSAAGPQFSPHSDTRFLVGGVLFGVREGFSLTFWLWLIEAPFVLSPRPGCQAAKQGKDWQKGGEAVRV